MLVQTTIRYLMTYEVKLITDNGEGNGSESCSCIRPQGIKSKLFQQISIGYQEWTHAYYDHQNWITVATFVDLLSC